MAKIKSKWWRPQPLTYNLSPYELRQQENDYRWWLASERGWSLSQVDIYLRNQRQWVAQQI